MVRALQIIVFLLAAAGAYRLEFGNDPKRFHKMEPFMAEGERYFAERAESSPLSVFFWADFDEWQRENVELKRRLGEEPKGELFCANGLNVAKALEDLWNEYTAETLRLLAISLTILLVVLMLVFRRRFLVYVLPIIAAILATAGTLGWLGEKLSFFELICFFVLTGLGIDYSIIHNLFAFLTSFIGFGSLYLTRFKLPVRWA